MHSRGCNPLAFLHFFPGFHVTLNVTLEGEVDPREISQILNDLTAKWKAMSKKRKRAEARA